ncbi:FtsX-like permease family protein [Sulfurimonas sp.]|uniref:ABC transporter permease n=1 Tax=Sulfurimonas sp. TaxID=2022749 RepID=UPI002625FA20|nr:FtsX-like permease family protein [Sulfurimonas sp.]MCW8895612.1 FtsX-like permease family protein [Sulfurimonas sp.]MCW9067162.1 FtsX-like permease family protein [Sulfurimonas sp.]
MYKLILKMAWKNSFTRPARTLLVITMIAVSMSMMLAIQGLYDGMVKNMVDKNKRSDSGDVSLYAKDYRVEKDIKYIIKDAVKMKEDIEKLEGVEAVVLRVMADGLLSTARKSSFASVYGIDLKAEEEFGEFSGFLKEGEINLDKRGAVIGIELAKTLKVGIGSKLVFSTQDTLGNINSIALKIKAIVQTTNILLDSNAIFVDIALLHKFLGTSPLDATQIAVMGEDKNLVKLLKAKYSNLDVKSFLELQPMIKQMQEMMVIFNSITFFIVMSVVFIGIFGVVYVSILDRIREFGIVLGIGMQYKYIKAQIFLESVIVGLLGYISGALLGAILLVYLRDYGLDLSSFSDALEMWGYEAIITGTIKVSYFTTTFVAILAASVLSVLIPIRKIKKLNPIDVIKAEK